MLFQLAVSVFLLTAALYVLWNWRPGGRRFVEGGEIASKVNDPSAIRSLGVLERWYSANHDSGVGGNFSLVLQLEGTIPSLRSLEEAVRKLMEANLALRVGVKDEYHLVDKPAYLRRISSPKSPIVCIERTRDDTWKAIIAREHETKFDVADENALLWKLFLVSSPKSRAFEIIFRFQHVPIDGMAGINIVQDFLKIFESGESLPSTDIPPPLDNVLDIRPKFGNILTELTCELFPILDPHRRSVYLGPPHIDMPISDRTSVISRVGISADETVAVRERAKQERTTFHAAVCAAAQFALAKMVAEPEVKSLLVSAVNLRGLCATPMPNNAGVFICGPHEVHLLTKNTKFWELARECKDKLTANIERDYQQIGILGFYKNSLLNFFSKKKALKPNGRSGTINISNLGHVDFPERLLGGCVLKDLWFLNTKGPEGPLYMISGLSANGRWSCSIAAPSPALQQHEVDEYGRLFMEALARSSTEPTMSVATF
eukprot:TRINITY_DN4597_c0_g1_i1.p1 TRINITY_DN4597_c0_g1~~TRINITY_DN4597_c0_g1_i1.p1  ORF type:complete len:488 (-),score=56.72 TRINITY_DN4597_c0_g1_i1:656-2119(-)